MFSDIEFPSMKSLFSSAASMTGTIIFLRTIAKDIIPPGLEYYLSDMFSRFMAALSSTTTVIIDEYEELSKNGLFSAAQVYISSIASPSTRRFRVSLPEKEKTIHVTVGKNEEIIDVFRGFHLTFHKKHKNRVIDEYLPYVLEKAKAVEEGKKTLKLYTLEPDTFHRRTNPWQSVNLDHPSNFKTLAMDEEIKKSVMDDLNRFLKRKELYRKVGKAWKRGYLLFGPPGTGKSSLIAAIANHLHFDVYDLELSYQGC